MKTIILLVGLFVIVAETASANDISVDSLASYVPVGPPNFPTLKVINNASELNDYCEVTNYDTSQLPSQPDFTSKTVIGLITLTIGGNRTYYRNLKRVYNSNDSVILEVKPDSQFVDPGISMQAGCEVLLFAIPKSDNVIVIKIANSTSVEKSFHHGIMLRSNQQKPLRLYSLQGRSFSAKSRQSIGLFIFREGQNRGKPAIIQ